MDLIWAGAQTIVSESKEARIPLLPFPLLLLSGRTEDVKSIFTFLALHRRKEGFEGRAKLVEASRRKASRQSAGNIEESLLLWFRKIVLD